MPQKLIKEPHSEPVTYNSCEDPKLCNLLTHHQAPHPKR